jgi:hypothetical protein
MIQPQTMNEQLMTYRDVVCGCNEQENIVNFCFDTVHLASNSEAPKTVQEALYRKEKETWIPSIASKIVNFLQRKCWKKVNRSIPIKNNQQTIMKTTWQFKNKLEQDKSIPHKSRVCSKGYQQVPGKDYMESSSPVATDSFMWTGMGIYLFYVDVYKGVTYEIEVIDIEAVVFEGEMDKQACLA